MYEINWRALLITLSVIVLAAALYFFSSNILGLFGSIGEGVARMVADTPDDLVAELTEKYNLPEVCNQQNGAFPVTLTYEQPAVRCRIPPHKKQPGTLNVRDIQGGSRINYNIMALSYIENASVRAGMETISGWVAIEYQDKWPIRSQNKWEALDSYFINTAHVNNKSYIKGKHVWLVRNYVTPKYIFYAPNLEENQKVSFIIEFKYSIRK